MLLSCTRMVKDVRPEYELICSCSQLIPGDFIFAAGKTDTLAYLNKGLKIGANRSLNYSSLILFMNDLSLPMTLSLFLVHQKASIHNCILNAFQKLGFPQILSVLTGNKIHKNV